MGGIEVAATLKRDKVYYVSYVLILISYVLLESNYGKIGIINLLMVSLRYISCVLVSVGTFAFTKKWKVSRGVLAGVSILLIICAAVTLSVGKQDNFLILLLFIILSYEIDSDKILKLFSTTVFAMVLLVAFSSILGVIDNGQLSSFSSGDKISLGFYYTTFASNFFFHAVLAYVAYRKDKLNYKEMSVLLICNYILFSATKTRAVFYLTNALLVIVTVLKIIHFTPNMTKRIPNFILKYSIPICAVITVLGQLYYNQHTTSRIMGMLNLLVSNRLALAKMGIQRYGISLFGTIVEWKTFTSGNLFNLSEYFYIDSSYIQISMIYGVAVLILLCIGFAVLGRRAVEEKNLWLSIAILFLAVHSMTDPQLISLKYNPFLILIIPAVKKQFNAKKKVLK